MKIIEYRPIGIIQSPFKNVEGMPIQPSAAKGIKGKLDIDPKYIEGLKDLEGFSHIILIYHLHLSEGYSLSVTPFLDTEIRGVFATRAPRRPNPIGISVVHLEKIENNIVHISNVDIVDGTPLLDIKPFIPEFQTNEDIQIGWLANKINLVSNKKSDNRFK